MTYNLSTIMTAANAYAKIMTRSLALRKAWAEAKVANLTAAHNAPENAPKNGFENYMRIREAMFAAKAALNAINWEAASPIEAAKNQLFVLNMKDRWNSEDREEARRLEKLLAA